MNQKEYFGLGSIGKLAEILKVEGAKKAFLVTGRESYSSSGAEDKLNKLFQKIKVERFWDFETNPKLEDIEKGVEVFRMFKPDIVVAVGGGSVMDVGKAVNFLAKQNEEPENYILQKKQPENRGLPLVAIPTTAGSGSEATHFAVVYVGKEKHSLAHEFVLPDYAIVDPELTVNLPVKITAVTGMDAFAQAIEAYWSVNSTEESKEYSRRAIELVWGNLREAVDYLLNSPLSPSLVKGGIQARSALAEGAHWAGKAINITKTTACHAISYPMTSYFGIPHGHAVGLTLGEMLVYNSQVTGNYLLDKRGVTYVRSTINEVVEMLGASDADEARNNIVNLMNDVDLETNISKLGIQESAIDVIIKNGFNPDRVKNNPRKLTKNNLKKILYSIW